MDHETRERTCRFLAEERSAANLNSHVLGATPGAIDDVRHSKRSTRFPSRCAAAREVYPTAPRGIALGIRIDHFGVEYG